jgi:hypothetical protein
MHPLQTFSTPDRRARLALKLAGFTVVLSSCDVDLREVYGSEETDAQRFDDGGGLLFGGETETPDAGQSYYGNDCPYAFDGECDEPNLCAEGTDSADCRGSSLSFGDAAPTPGIEIGWLDGMTLVVAVGVGREFGPYRFGLAETGNGDDGWDGEDCIPGDRYGYDLCHHIPAEGTLVLASIHPEVGGSLEQLEEDLTTLITPGLGDGVTFVVLREAGNTPCWTWGHDPQHYMDELGCAPL